MNQTCKVCGEPAAGFHFGAFTCEGCKSFFGRSYNNLSSISECKNNSECVINKKNRTACKACRLRKCLMVGMSKSGSRYGRRSNWFKIHCLLNEQSHQNSQIQQQQQSSVGGGGPRLTPRDSGNHHQQPPPSPFSSAGLSLLGQPFGGPLMHLPKTKEELRLLGLDDYSKTSPSVSSPESHNSDSSVEISDARRLPLGFPGLHPGLFGTAFGPHHGILFPPTFHPAFYNGLLRPSPNNNNSLMRDHNVVGVTEELQKRVFLDAVLQSQRRSPTPEVVRTASPPVAATTPPPVVEQNAPIDLSMKTLSERGSSPAHSDRSGSVMTSRAGSDADEEESDDCSDRSVKRIEIRPIALDLTTKV